jgi:gliding motility-associated lipoprotein GldH
LFKIKELKKLLLPVLLCALLVGCDNVGFYEKTAFFPSHEWDSKEQPAFMFTITDTVSLYNIYAVVRHEDAYRYNNIWLEITTQAPLDTAKTQKVNLQLADNKKGWLGVGMDDIFDHRIKLTAAPIQLKSGNYTFTLKQLMREDPLTAMLNAGIRIEKAQK